MKHIIAGIDPGKHAAVACIDLDGKVVHLATGLFVGTEWLVGQIGRAGSPVVIASDKKRPDDTPKKIAAIFGAVLFSSDYDISVKRKHELARIHKVGTAHERDALSAAITAYNSYKNKLNQAGSFAKKNGIGDMDMVKAMVIKRYSMHEAITERMVSTAFKRT
jgi:hypothetical protein